MGLGPGTKVAAAGSQGDLGRTWRSQKRDPVRPDRSRRRCPPLTPRRCEATVSRPGSSPDLDEQDPTVLDPDDQTKHRAGQLNFMPCT